MFLDRTLTEVIGRLFSEILILVLMKVFEDCQELDRSFGFESREYLLKCIALSKVMEGRKDLQRWVFFYFSAVVPEIYFSFTSSFAYDHFRTQVSPFWNLNDANASMPQLRLEDRDEAVCDLQIVKACYRFLNSNPSLFTQLWQWSVFLDTYWQTGCEKQKYYCSKIIAIVTNASQSKLMSLFKASNISIETLLVEERGDTNQIVLTLDDDTDKETIITVNNNDYLYIEGIFLPIYSKANLVNNDPDTEPYLVPSTIANLRSLALAVSANKPVCLTGPVGCGKTMLVEYLARKTGRLIEFDTVEDLDESFVADDDSEEKLKRKREVKQQKDVGNTSKQSFFEETQNEIKKSAFLRIQLGDQTDSKTLLGQYRCTDVPGEFVWQPGVLTQAVMHGYWILLEDLNSATQDVCTVLTSLLENNYLTVPGFRDNMKVAPGFQLFLTLR